MRCLDIGAGGLPYRPNDAQWEHSDIRAIDHIELVCDSRQIPVPDETYDRLRASHHLEHIEHRDVGKALKEWHRILKPDGSLEIIVPNFDEHFRKLPELAEDLTRIKGNQHQINWHVGYLYGGQAYEDDYHKVPLLKNLLYYELYQAGFPHIESLPSDETHVRAWKTVDPKETQQASNKDNFKVNEIEGKSFFIVNTSGWGDILATTATIHELKKRGANWVVLGSRCWGDFSLIRQNGDLEYLFAANRTGSQFETITDRLAQWYYNRADYHIHQTSYQDARPYDFYTQRLACVGIDPTTCKGIKPHIELAGHVIPDLQKIWLPQMGIRPGEYMVLHYQATHDSRKWYFPYVIEFCQMCANANIQTIVVGQSSAIAMETSGVHNWTHQKSFDSAVGLVQLCKAVVCTDSVFSHIAHGFDKPMVVLYSDAPPEARLQKHAKQLIALQGKPGQPEGIMDISSKAVFAALETMI